MKSDASKLTEKLLQTSTQLPAPLNHHRYIDKNIHETIEYVQYVTFIHHLELILIWQYRSYDIHMQKLNKIRDEIEKKRSKKVNVDVSYEHLKSQILNNKLRTHEF